MQSLVARLLVAFGLVIVFLLPLGFAVAAISAEASAAYGDDSFFQGFIFPWWLPSSVVLAILALLLLWVRQLDGCAAHSVWTTPPICPTGASLGSGRS